MKQITHDNPLVLQLTPDELVLYLKRTGWAEMEVVNPKIFFLSGPEDDFGNPLELFVPRDPAARHFPFVAASAVNLLSALNGKSPWEISETIHSILFDVIGLRFNDALTLNAAQEILQEAFRFIGFAASTELKARPYNERISPSAKHHAAQCKMGHTRPGSYILTIRCPVMPEEEEDEKKGTGPKPAPIAEAERSDAGQGAPDPVTFERRVVERVVRCVHIASIATSIKSEDYIVEHLTTGFNGNMCESLQKITNIAPGNAVALNVNWSPEVQHSSDDLVDIHEPVVVRPPTRQWLQRAAEKFNAQVAQPEPEPKPTKVFGLVTMLRSEDEEPGDLLGKPKWVAVKWREPQSKTKYTVNIRLEPRWYRQACDAHKTGHSIQVVGQLERKHNRFEIVEPIEFQVVEW